MTAAPPVSPPESPFARLSALSALARWWQGFGRAPRIMGLDVARALAVLGMVGAHVATTAEEVRVFEPDTWNALVHGRSSILFAVLAGISISLMTGRTRIPRRDDLPRLRLNLIGRGAAVFVIGIVLELLGTPVAVILTVYGLVYVAAIPMLRWRVRHLLLAAGVLAVAGPPLLALARVLSLGATGPGTDMVLFGTYPITVWMALVLVGMAIGRLRVDTARTAGVLLVAGIVFAVGGYGLGALGGALQPADGDEGSSIVDGSGSEEMPAPIPASEVDFGDAVCDSWGDGEFSCYPQPSQSELDAPPSGSPSTSGIDEGYDGGGGWSSYPQALAEQLPGEAVVSALVSSGPHSGGTAEILGSGGFAVAVIGACLLLSRPLRWVLLPFAALGSMPLTAYSAHIVAIVAIAGPAGLPDGEHAWGWFSLSLLVATTGWAIIVGQGPLERLVARAAAAMSAGAAPAPAAPDRPRVDA